MATKELIPEKTKSDRLQMSIEEFFAWADEDTHAEWVDGKVIVFMTAKNVHQNVLELLFSLLDMFVRLFQLGKVRIAPYAMKLRDGRFARFLAASHLAVAG